MVNAVLFDLDGTLVDTAPDLAHALNQQRQMHGLPEMPFELIRPYASHGTVGLLQVGFSISPEHPAFAELRSEYLSIFEENANPYSQLFPGMMELLDELEIRGIPWGVVTNNRCVLPRHCWMRWACSTAPPALSVAIVAPIPNRIQNPSSWRVGKSACYPAPACISAMPSAISKRPMPAVCLPSLPNTATLARKTIP
jgi:Predicted phosphatases